MYLAGLSDSGRADNSANSFSSLSIVLVTIVFAVVVILSFEIIVVWFASNAWSIFLIFCKWLTFIKSLNVFV